jgi:hypothetical protein
MKAPQVLPRTTYFRFVAACSSGTVFLALPSIKREMLAEPFPADVTLPT